MRKKSDNPLREYFESNKDGKLIHKWLHYFDIYHRHFNKYIGKPITLIEFGVSHGGSLDMWRDYFGPKAKIIGVDINPECKKFVDKNTKIYIGDQEDKAFLAGLIKEVGTVDIVIDDGGHTVGQQTTTFGSMYPSVAPGGTYLVEDLHTNYWDEFGGGYKKPGTFIEMAKGLTDQLNSWHSRDNGSFSVDDFTTSTQSIHFYDSVVVFEKERTGEPGHKQVGKQSLSNLESWQYRSRN